MSGRIKAKFSALKKQKKTGFISFTMAYDPDKETSFAIMKKLPEAGVDIIEFGMPFSDPMADGPAIQKADIRALKAGATLRGILDLVVRFREQDNVTPVVLMGYYNPLYAYGLERFVKDAVVSGVDGLLIVDLPPEEDATLFALTQKHKLDLIKLVTPTTDEARLKLVLEKASGFLYYVSVAGVTGTKTASYDSVKDAVSFFKQHTDLPVAVGFGIKSKDDVNAVSHYADAVVVGSALVTQLDTASPMAEDVLSFCKELTGV